MSTKKLTVVQAHDRGWHHPLRSWHSGTCSRWCGQAGSGRGLPRPCPAWPSHAFGVGSSRAETIVCSSIIVRPCANGIISRRLQPASSCICLHCQLVYECQELLRLTNEKPVGRPGLDRSHCTPTPRYLGRAND